MKLILSRKGFDSGVANCASPILPDGAMVSLPIPLPSSLHYRDIAWRGRSLGPVVEALSRGTVTANDPAHLDPDLAFEARPRLPGWRPAFGQVAAAQTHLAAQGVGPGDLFLFFGWFRRVDGNATRFLLDAPDEHVLFGWLQIGEICPVHPHPDRLRARHPWLASHPHLDAPGRPNDTIYLASDRLVLAGRDMGVAGAGVFPAYHPAIRLTAPGSRTRRSWRLPGWLHPTGTTLTYHADPAKWGEPGETVTLTSVSQGQEFVATVSPSNVAEWMTTLLIGCQSDGFATDEEI